MVSPSPIIQGLGGGGGGRVNVDMWEGRLSCCHRELILQRGVWLR